MANLSVEERLALIRENLAEVLNPEIIEGAMAEGRNPKIYFGICCRPFGTGIALIETRNCDHWTTSLWILRAGHEDCPVARCWL